MMDNAEHNIYIMTEEGRIGKELVGSGPPLFEMPSENLSGWTE
jgi:hypothetical protein